MWDVFMDQFEVLATKAPVMLVAGNHERDFPSSGDRFNTASDSGEAPQDPYGFSPHARLHDAVMLAEFCALFALSVHLCSSHCQHLKKSQALLYWPAFSKQESGPW